jgi:anaerobic nitric oxide reductase flavorubredoxin
MKTFEIAPNIHWVGIASKEKGLFENLWELDHGVNYNSYLLSGEKSALIDVCPEQILDELIAKIVSVSDLSKLSYLVFNHLEPDHTGAVAAIRKKLPGLEIIASKKGVEMLGTLFGIRENVREVKEGDALDLGGLILRFMMTPMIHWPETMMAFEETTKTLFSSDCFGAFGATESSIFDDEAAEAYFDDERFRYFVNVFGSHSRHIEKALPRVAALSPTLISPSHGPVYRDTKKIMDAYSKWCGYGAGNCEEYVPLISSTMYGRTGTAVLSVQEGLSSSGVLTKVLDAIAVPPSFILPEIYKAKGLLIAAPTYDGGLFPKIGDILLRAKAKDIKGKKVIFCGSFAWAPAAKKGLSEWCEKLSWELVDSVEFNGMVTDEARSRLIEMGRKFGEFLKALPQNR